MKSITFFLLACFALTACQKEVSYEVDPGTTGGSGSGNGSGGSGSGGSSTGTYFIKGKKDGTAFSFTTNTMAKVTDLSSVGGGISLALVASASAPSIETFDISASFPSASAIPTGTFTETNNGFDQVVLGIYIPNTTAYSYDAGVSATTALPLKLTILTKTATETTGSFEGAFYKVDATGTPSTDHVTFTEGTFDLPVK